MMKRNVQAFLISIALIVLLVSCSTTGSQSVTEPYTGKCELAGSWMGKLNAEGQILRIGFKITEVADNPGTYTGYALSPDQTNKEFPLSAVTLKGPEVYIEIAVLKAKYTGTFIGKDQIKGFFEQAGYKFDLQLGREALPDMTRPQDPKAPFPYKDEEVTITNKEAGITLGGTLTIPDDKKLANADGKLPIVVMITGSGAQNRNEEIMNHRPFLVIADYLARAGFAVLRMDDRGVGKSVGTFQTANSLDFAGDIWSAVQYLKGRPELDKSRIGLCGHSEGGLIDFIVASQHPEEIGFIISLAGPGMRGKELLLEQSALIARAEGATEDQIAANAEINAKLFDAVIAHAGDTDPKALEDALGKILDTYKATGTEKEQAIQQLASPWMRFFIPCDPAVYIKGVKCPVLALNGELDLQVPFKENLAIIGDTLAKAGNTAVTVKSFPGLNHLFQHAKTGSPGEYASISETFSAEVLAYMKDWLLKTVGTLGK